MFRNDSTVLPGDSGGPVFAQGKDGRFYQVGFNTFMFYGLPYQSFATEISHYCPWIEETTGGEVKCQTFDPTKIVPPF
uniref:Peptidase S1 domain-containing protein n=1 Tax=Panagrolaimus sp. JU765 TaxID=591449 RepID=A0AC34R5G2_9BILA